VGVPVASADVPGDRAEFGLPLPADVLAGLGLVAGAASAGSALPAGFPSRPSGMKVLDLTRIREPPVALLMVTERAAPACPDPAMIAGAPVRACGMGVAAPADTGAAVKPTARTNPAPAAT